MNMLADMAEWQQQHWVRVANLSLSVFTKKSQILSQKKQGIAVLRHYHIKYA